MDLLGPVTSAYPPPPVRGVGPEPAPPFPGPEPGPSPGPPSPLPDPGTPYPAPDPGRPYPVPDPGSPSPGAGVTGGAARREGLGDQAGAFVADRSRHAGRAGARGGEAGGGRRRSGRAMNIRLRTGRARIQEGSLGSERGIVAYSNRLPVARSSHGWKPSSGGLVSALTPVLARGGGAWVGWDGDSRDLPRRVEGIEVDLCPVVLSRREVDAYYHGFSNRTLWPLLHGLIEEPVYDRRWWHVYREVNARFAAADISGAGAGALRWVHDYQLTLVPELLRRQSANSGPIGFFLAYRSRHPRSSRGCPGANRSSTACSAPMLSPSTPTVTARTSWDLLAAV